ncbi:MAG: EpsI family protein [Alphaproteobacteria bacterium]|nr:EpsI family protein [Alphaproteobacteria bacterium]
MGIPDLFALLFHPSDRLLGNLASINEVQQFAAVALFQMVVWTIVGSNSYRTILFPCLFLFFLVPVGQYLVPPLQTLTTWFVSAGLSALGVLHYTEGNVIELPNGRFEVAEACAGLRFLVSNIVLCTLFAYFAFRTWRKLALFMVAAVTVPILANCLRALGIVLIAHWTDNKLAVGADHLVYGWGFSVLILLLLFGIGARFRDPVGSNQQLLYFIEPDVPFRSRFFATAALAGFVLAIPPGLLEAKAAYFPPTDLTLARPQQGGWTSAALKGPWSPKLSGADKQFRLTLQRDSAAPIDFVLNYYRDHTKTHALAESQLWDESHYNLISAGNRSERWAGGTLPLRELVLSSPTERRLVWWCYWKDGQFSTSGTTVKLLSVKNAFRAHTGIALVAMSVPILENEQAARASLRSSLWTMKIFPAANAEAN